MIVNQRFATQYWPDRDPLGRRLRLYTGDTPGPWLTVVGLAPDLHHGDPAQREPDPALYVPLRQRPTRGAWVLARTDGVSPAALTPDVRRVVQAVDPDLPLWLGPYTLTDWLAESYWRRRVNAGLLTGFATLALGLACLGLFAVVAHEVAERSRELAIRVALGATRRHVAIGVAWRAVFPAVVGLVVGLAISLATNRLLASQLADVPWWDPYTAIGAVLVLGVAALAACALPVWRAIGTDPLVVLRLE